MSSIKFHLIHIKETAKITGVITSDRSETNRGNMYNNSEPNKRAHETRKLRDEKQIHGTYTIFTNKTYVLIN